MALDSRTTSTVIVYAYGPIFLIFTSVCLMLKKLTSTKQSSHQSSSDNNRLLTRIHGKWYNLSTFDHPGGPVALSLAKGRDATALFESHHPFMPRKKMAMILSKCEVSADDAKALNTLDPRDSGSEFNWDEIDKDGFANDLRALVVDYFTSLAAQRGTSIIEATKATPWRWLVVCTLLLSFFTSLNWFVQGYWAFIVITPVLAWLAGVNYWHDALHFALSSSWRINAYLPYLLPLLSSPRMWYHQHIIGHHVYTNIGHKDPDLAHNPQLMREHESVRWRPTHLNQASFSRTLFVWSNATSLGLNIINDIRATTKLTYNNVVF
ncbi:hypothetical protein ACHAXR_001895, partial [Thalassiosira sp. AJA248-18]